MSAAPGTRIAPVYWRSRTIAGISIALERYDDLLHRVYDSALAPGTWPATLAVVAAVFGEGSELVPRDQLVKSRSYTDLWLPQDIKHLSTGTLFAGGDGRQLPMALSLYRSPRDPPFDAREVGQMRRLLVHLSRALGVMFHLQDQSRQIASSRAALDRGDLVQRTPHPARATGSASTYRLASANESPRQQAAFGKARAAALAAYRKEEGFEHFAEAVILAPKANLR